MNGYNFSEAVRVALASAREEAARLGHDYVGTEHEVLGLLRHPNIARSILEARRIPADRVRTEIDRLIKPGRVIPRTTDMPYTSRAKKSLELAMTEARELGHDHVDCGHLLLGIMRENGPGATALQHAGLDIDAARWTFAELVGTGQSDPGGFLPREGPKLSGRTAATMLTAMANSPDIARVFAEHEIDLPTLIEHVRLSDRRGGG